MHRMSNAWVKNLAGRFIVFDGPDGNEDFGLEQVTSDPAHRYQFRTSPLRNVALQPAFFHNGAFRRWKTRSLIISMCGRL